MTYKVIPGPRTVGIKDGHYNEATDLFQQIINLEAKDGWNYHSMEVITTTAQTGCALSPQFVETKIYMLIFSKE